jgi:hypothetical protein
VASGSLDEELDRLYGMPPDEFVGARDALAKELRTEGRRDDAATVKALRRPSVAAWAVNQIGRRHPSQVDALLEAGVELRKAQRRALSGVAGAGGLREAGETRRKAVRELVGHAQAILSEAGHVSTATLDAVQGTLEAASVDEEAGRAVREGRLTKEFPTPAGFGTVEGLSLVEAPPSQPSAPVRGRGKPAREPDRRRDAAARRSELRAAVQLARAEARDRERAADRARKDAARVGQAAVEAAEQAERAQHAAEDSRRRARDLAAAARHAASDASRAEREAVRAAKALDEAEERLGE